MWDVIGTLPKGAGNGTVTKTKKPSSTRKYICPCCHQSVRATKAVNILCGDCMEQVASLKVPLTAEANYGKSWYEAK